MRLPKLNGEFWINDQLCYSTLTPSLRIYGGLTIWRFDERFSKESDVCSNYGPFFCSPFITFDLFTTKHSLEEMKEGPTYQFTGTNLGSIWMIDGRAASEGDGSWMRRVKEMTFSLQFEKKQIRFEVSGKTGYLVEGTYPSETDPVPHGVLKFRIWFVIPIDQISKTIEVNEEGIKNLVQKLSKLI